VSDNTIVFHIQLLLPQGQNLGQMLCAEGYAELDPPIWYRPNPVPQPSDPTTDSNTDDAVNEPAAMMEDLPLIIRPPISPRAAASESGSRLSTKRLVCNFSFFFSSNAVFHNSGL